MVKTLEKVKAFAARGGGSCPLLPLSTHALFHLFHALANRTPVGKANATERSHDGHGYQKKAHSFILVVWMLFLLGS